MLIAGRSQDEEIVREIIDRGPYDWVFIDGDHERMAVAADVETALSVTDPDGVVVLHDIVPPTGGLSYPPGDIFDVLETLYRAQRFVDEGDLDVPHGIGVVYVGDRIV